MRVNPIQQRNYKNNNTNFKGSVDKSFTNYLDMVRRDVVSAQDSFYRSFSLETVKETKTLISNIMERVSGFMAKTNEDTVLCLIPTRKAEEGEVFGELRFKNKKTDTQIDATYFSHEATEEVSKKVLTPWGTWPEITILPRQTSDLLRGLNIRGKFDNIRDLRKVNTWSEELVKQAEPIDVDLALIEKYNKDHSKKIVPLRSSTNIADEIKKENLDMKQAIKDLKNMKI